MNYTNCNWLRKLLRWVVITGNMGEKELGEINYLSMNHMRTRVLCCTFTPVFTKVKYGAFHLATTARFILFKFPRYQ